MIITISTQMMKERSIAGMDLSRELLTQWVQVPWEQMDNNLLTQEFLDKWTWEAQVPTSLARILLIIE
jgi:hypothetical protein